MEESDRKRRLSSSPRWAAAVLAFSLLVLVALAALGAQGLPGSEVRPPPLPVNINVVLVLQIMLGMAAALITLALILALLPGGPPLELPERSTTSFFRLMAVIVGLLVILNLLQPFLESIDFDLQQSGQGDNDTATQIDDPPPQQSGSRWTLLILGGTVLLIAVSAAAATRRTTDPDLPTETSIPTEIAGAIDVVLAELEDSTNPREVVIGAYARMEHALTTAGLPPRPSEAPLQYLARSLEHLDVSGRAVTRLTNLFEVARFSDHDVPQDMGHEAIAALREIRDELTEVPV